MISSFKEFCVEYDMREGIQQNIIINKLLSIIKNAEVINEEIIKIENTTFEYKLFIDNLHKDKLYNSVINAKQTWIDDIIKVKADFYNVDIAAMSDRDFIVWLVNFINKAEELLNSQVSFYKRGRTLSGSVLTAKGILAFEVLEKVVGQYNDFVKLIIKIMMMTSKDNRSIQLKVRGLSLNDFTAGNNSPLIITSKVENTLTIVEGLDNNDELRIIK